MTDITTMESNSASGETSTPLSKGDKGDKKREASSPLDAQGVQLELKKNRHESGASVSSEGDNDISDLPMMGVECPVHLLSQPMNPSDIVQIASELRSIMLPEISQLIKNQLPDIKSIVLEAVNDLIAPLKDEIRALKEEVSGLKLANEQLEKRLIQSEYDKDSLEQYSRRNSVRISGVPESEQENTDEIILKIARDLGVELEKSEIDRSHRVGRHLTQGPIIGRTAKASRRHRDILVKFATYNARQRLFSKRKELRDSMTTKNVFINEDLTKPRSKLLFDARSLVRGNCLKAAYSSDGRIFIRDKSDRRHLILNDSDLLKFGDTQVSRGPSASLTSLAPSSSREEAARPKA